MAKELTVKSKFFAMEDKVIVEGSAIDTAERFEKVYVDALPEAVQTAIASHFDDTNKKVTLSKEELKNYVFANALAFKNTAFSVFSSNATKYGEITFTYASYSYNSKIIFVQPYSGSESSTNSNTVIKVDSNKKFVISPLGKTTFSNDFDNSLIIKLEDSAYSEFKQAITKDLLANLGYVVIPSEETVDEKIAEIPNVEEAPSGTIASVLGLDSNGDLVKGTISGGTKLYKHWLAHTNGYKLNVISTIEDTNFGTNNANDIVNSIINANFITGGTDINEKAYLLSQKQGTDPAVVFYEFSTSSAKSFNLKNADFTDTVTPL